jgi:hypothetical protein
MAAPGTLKRGAPSAPSVTTVLNFTRPAGRKLKLRTQKEPEFSPEVDQAHIHGAGSTAPVAVAQGHGKPQWKTTILSTEYDALVDIAAAAGIPVMGQGGLLFDQVQTTTVDGIPKRTTMIEGCSIGKVSKKVSAEGNMVDLEGLAMNQYENGAPLFKVAE